MLASLRCKKCCIKSVYAVGWRTRNAVGKSKSYAFRRKNESPRKSLLLAHGRSTCKGLTDPWWRLSFAVFLPYFRPTRNDWRPGAHRLPSKRLPVNGYYVYTALFFLPKLGSRPSNKSSNGKPSVTKLVSTVIKRKIRKFRTFRFRLSLPSSLENDLYSTFSKRDLKNIKTGRVNTIGHALRHTSVMELIIGGS